VTSFRILIILLAMLTGTASASAKAAAAGPSLVFDPGTGEVLSQDRAGEPWYPASLTKLMTAYIVFDRLKSGKMTLEQKLPVSQVASAQPPSKIGMKPGSSISTNLALQSLLIYSANDMAYVLAEGAAGSVDAFVREMNATAKKLGMTGTRFANPNGLFDPRQITTARDIAILATALLKTYPERAHYFSQDAVAIGKRRLPNRNSLLRQMKAADGMKTGFVCNSGFNLVATATIDGRKLGAVIFGASSGKHRADLAEMLLVDAFGRSDPPQRQPLSGIANMALGGIVPADLTTTICRQKAPVQLVSSKELQGWGISFGTYDTAVKADMALRGRLLSASAAGLSGPAGVIRMPGKAGFAAVVWKLAEPQSLTACASYRQEQSPCDVLTPETFAQIAALTPEPPPKPKPQTVQGSDSGKTKNKKKNTKKKP
jgi:D-alanyl-D-alanine carboxypeptidase